MRRILIVDDEPIIVQGLLSAVSERMPEADLYSAYSGEDALRLLSETRMDIVLSDMAMPGMDGLQLMERIRSQWPECRVIFLSGHSEFDMMYRAIRGKAVTFLLKTEGFDRIVSVLRDTVKSLDSDEEHREALDRLSAQQEVTRQFLQREALSSLIRGRISRLHSETLEIDPSQPMLPLYAYIESSTDGCTLEEFNEKLLLTDRVLRGQLSGYPVNIAFWNRHEDLLWLLQPEQGADMHRCMLCARENMELIQEGILNETGMTLAFALHTSAVTADRLSDTYQSLRRRICQGAGVPGMIALQPCDARSASSPLLSDTLVSRFREALEHMNESALPGLLDRVTSVFRCAAPMDDPYMLEAFMTVSHLFLSYINRWKLHESVRFPGGLSGLTGVSGFTSWSQTADAFRDLGLSLLRLREGDQGNRSRETVEKIRAHIERSLRDPDALSLSRISEITYFNPAYLSRLFHQLTGETLSEYISSARIRRANRLLADPELRVSEIAEAVGFSVPANFSRFYRKMTGRSPQEYRDSLAGCALESSRPDQEEKQEET